tara:strand:+ start:85 stop:807 length:723 start_codon:yes stop_codon:yes gene_type:complete
MKISESKLKDIIIEEIREYLTEIATCHNPSTGFFDDCEEGNVYSLSTKGASKNKVDKKYVGRGTVSSKQRKKDGTVAIKSKFGMNTSKKKAAGRIEMPDGSKIPAKYSVSKYPEKYTEQKGQKFDPNWESAKKRKRDDSIQKPNRKNWFHGYDEMDKLVRGVGLGVLEEEDFWLDGPTIARIVMETFPSDNIEESRGTTAERCRSLGLITVGEAQKRILGSLNAFSLAQDGKLNVPRDKQ